MHVDTEPTGLYGLMAEFDRPGDLIVATRKAKEAGYSKLDAYSPYPIEEVSEEICGDHNDVPIVVLLGGITGLLFGLALEYFISVIEYPMNVGGRPFHSWPQFIPVTFETTVLGAALTCFFGMWALNRLPQPYHPVFNAPAFGRASTDRFFLCIEAEDPRFERDATWRFLEGLHPVGVSEVAP
jgi:hypothetical protein